MSAESPKRKLSKRKKSSPISDPTALESGHHMGEQTGFDVHDGKIFVCSSIAQHWDRIEARRSGLNAYVKSLNKFLAAEYASVAAEEHRWWNLLVGDLGLDSSVLWTYDPFAKCIRVKEKQDEVKKSGDTADERGNRQGRPLVDQAPT